MKPLMKQVLAVLAGTILVAGNLCAKEISADQLKFQATESGGFKFDTGVLRGMLRAGGKSDGLSSVVHTPSGTVLDQSKGLFGFYRVFTIGRRYGDGGAWDWESTARLRADGSVEAFWPAAKERPFEIGATYRWSNPATLDLEIKVKALEALPKFELFLASYFKGPFTNALVFAKENDSSAPQFLRAGQEFGIWQCFPRDAAAVKIVQDGRWKFPPNPVEWMIRTNYTAPLAFRRNEASQVSAVVMARREDCFAVLTPHETEKHNSLYLSLFGRDLKQGETAVAHARLVIAENLSPNSAATLYEKFVSESVKERDKRGR